MASEETEQLAVDGQEVEQFDFNLVAAQASRAEDWIFAEILRLSAPYTGSSYAKAVIPPGPFWGAGFGGFGGVAQAIATPQLGGVTIGPFRAIVGPRLGISAYTPPPAAPPLVTGQNNPTAVSFLRGIRSGMYIPTDDNATIGHTVALAANSSGNPRIDLIYAQLTADAPSGTVTRNVRAPVVGSSPVATSGLALGLVQPITINVVAGTPGATPGLPALPADTPSSNIWNIPLAYVIVPNGFSPSASTAGLIQIIAPCVSADGKVSGAARLRPATCMTTDPTFLGSTSFGLPAIAAAAGKISWPVPSSMVGGEALFLTLPNVGSGSSIVDTSIVDQSIDWGGRAFLWFAQCVGGTLSAPPPALSYDQSGFPPAANTLKTPGSWSGSSTLASSQVITGMGQSFLVDDAAQIPGMDVGSTRQGSVVAALTQYNASEGGAGMPNTGVLALYVVKGSPQLRAYVNLPPNDWVSVTLWLFATAQLESGNY